MIKTIFFVLLFFILGAVFFPYIQSLVNFVSSGLGHLITILETLGIIVFTFLNSLIKYQYIMLLLSIYVCLAVFFYLLDNLGGE